MCLRVFMCLFVYEINRCVSVKSERERKRTKNRNEEHGERPIHARTQTSSNWFSFVSLSVTRALNVSTYACLCNLFSYTQISNTNNAHILFSECTLFLSVCRSMCVRLKTIQPISSLARMSRM